MATFVKKSTVERAIVPIEEEDLSMGELNFLYEPDHENRALGRLISKLEKPRIQALVKAFAYGCQIIEDLNFDLMQSYLIASAKGAQLKVLGEIVGEKQQGAQDPVYRNFIRARRLVNKCTVTPDELIVILQIITSPSIVRYYHLYHASCTLWIDRNEWMTDAIVAKVRRIMLLVQPAGKTMQVFERIAGSTTLFARTILPVPP